MKYDPLEIARSVRYRDSIECKVLEFFDRNPDEELSPTDVVLKYGARLDTVCKLMRSMLARGLLLSRHEGRLTLYRRFP